MKPEQPQLPFNEAPTGQVVERVRPEGIPEEAWIVIQGLRNRTPEPRLLPNNPVKPRDYDNFPKGAR